MMQKSKRFGAILLALVMLAAFVPVIPAASAETEGDYEYEVENGKATITRYNGSGGNVTIPGKLGGAPVTVIGDYAFSECDSLESITLGNGVTTIGNNAFSSCYSLRNVTLGNSVTTIGDYGFYNCTSLESITIPDSVTTIGNGVFANCNTLSEISLGSGLTSIGANVFNRCTITMSEENPVYAVVDGALFSKDLKTLIKCLVYISGAYSIPNNVTTIDANAFYGFRELESVTIPNSVTTIGDDAFASCETLSEVSLGSGLTSIGANVFNRCFLLENITIPDRITTIGEFAFSNARSLKDITIPDSVTTIGAGAFSYCDSLTSVTIGKNATSIGNQAFAACDSLSKITVSEENPAYTVVDDVMYSMDMKTIVLTSVGISGSFTIPDSVTTIGDYGFYNCTSLESITIPKSVTTVGSYSFIRHGENSTESLKNLTINCYPDSAAHNYAKMRKIKVNLIIENYTVQFDKNGGTGTMKDQTHTIGSSAELTANSFTRTGYAFDGWNTKADGSGTKYTDEQSVTDLAEADMSITLYAQWKANTYAVKFDKNGGSGTMKDQVIEEEASTALAVNAFKRTGYTFTGWNTNKDGSGTKYADKASVKNLAEADKSITLYAQWEANTYTVKFNKNGGTGTMKDQTHTIDKSAKLTANSFTRKGYVFGGWNTKKNGTGTQYTDKKSVRNLKASGSITLYAQWTIVTAPTKAVTSLKLTSPKTKQLKVTYKAVSGAAGYRIEYSTSKSFTKATTKTVHTTKLTYTLKSLKAKTTYYVRVTALKTDSQKNKIYSTKTATKSLKTK